MKDTMMCVRVSSDLRRALERISKAERRSLSSTVEYILHATIEERESQGFGEGGQRFR
jgi:predicted transcriptional regulator